MLTFSDDEDILMSALRGGADGFLLKNMDIDEVCEKLSSASQGNLVLSEELVDKLVRAQRKKGQLTDPGLTDREWEIVNLIAEGLANKAIARRLDITEGTVKQHIKNVFKKTNLHSRLEVAIWGRDKGQKHGG
jgi:two-component system nitrate/nitrite response regulator NarL